MVNHFASLLGNFDLWARNPTITAAGVADVAEDVLAIDDDTYLASGGFDADISAVQTFSQYISRDYRAVHLPPALLGVHTILFPPAQKDQHALLLYAYLCVVGATSMADAVYVHDPRITYDVQGDPTFLHQQFDVLQKLRELEQRTHVLDRMFEYQADKFTPTYENVWRQHFNSVYRLAGLLLAYTQRVHLVWTQETA